MGGGACHPSAKPFGPVFIHFERPSHAFGLVALSFQLHFKCFSVGRPLSFWMHFKRVLFGFLFL